MARIKEWLKRTPLYPVLRAGWNAIRPKSRWERIDRRDSRQLTAILRRVLLDGGNAIDVGAHRGDVLAHLVRLSPRGKHIALEPIPELAEQLRIAFPQVMVHAVAVGETAGTTEFQWITSNPAFSGLKRRPDLRPEESVRTLTIPIVRLDDLVPAGMPIAVIKIDVEGAELGVLRGARRVLGANRPWVFIEHGSAAAVYGTTTKQIAVEFAQHGMAVWRMGDWLAGKRALTEEEFAAAVDSGDYWNFLAGPAGSNRA